MEGRTIATHGGGDLVIGGGPPIDGVLHAWFYPEGQRGQKGPHELMLGQKGTYGFMLGHREAAQLAVALEMHAAGEVKTFRGSLKLTVADVRGSDLLTLWFYTYGEAAPEQVVRLYDGAIDAASDAIGEALNPMAPMPAGLHDASLTMHAREELEQLLAEGLIRKAA